MDVVIVGAGLAGLMCAKTLRDLAPDIRVLVVEARSTIGGRVSTNETFSAHQPVEMGAELIHGTTTVLNSLVNDTVPVFTWAHGDGGPHPTHLVQGGGGYYYLGAEGRLLRFDSQDPDFLQLNEVLQNLPSSDTSMWEYVKSHVPDRMQGLAEAGYANTLCSELRLLPLRQVATVMDGFRGDGETELRCPRGYTSLLARLRRDVEVWTDWPVAHVHWGQGAKGVTLVSDHGERIHAKRVVLTPSVAVMKQQLIRFDPPLSEHRMRIYRAIRMEPCLKLALRFRKRVWPVDFHGMICADCPIPEFWTITPPTDTTDFILIGFATSTFATTLGKLSRQELKDTALAQLDQIFGHATEVYVDMVVQDWTRERYVQGGYSSPSLHVTTEDREYIGSSIQRTLYFAGEATCPTRYMVMHAAMESGVRVAHEIMMPTSKL